MALNIKKLGTRALTALVFVVILMACILFNYFVFTFFFLIISIWGLFEFYKALENVGISCYKMPGYILSVFLYLAFIRLDFILGEHERFYSMRELFIVFPFIILSLAIFDKKEKPFTNAIFTMGGILYSVLPFALLHEIVFMVADDGNAFKFNPYMLFGIILLIWSNDTFAYLGGSIFGKNKMVERISPGKTWEGTIIGIILTFGGSFIIRSFFPENQHMFWLVAGLAVPVLSTIGDLIQSILKRQCNLKDTGYIMPGHGGILDRFDSLIFVTPFIILISKLIT